MIWCLRLMFFGCLTVDVRQAEAAYNCAFSLGHTLGVSTGNLELLRAIRTQPYRLPGHKP